MIVATTRELDCIVSETPTLNKFWNISRFGIRVAQLSIVVKTARIQQIVSGNKYCVMKPTWGLNHLSFESWQRPVNSWGKFVAEVSLPELTIIISANRVNQMKVWIWAVLTHDNCVVVWTWDAEDFYAVLDVTQNHLRITDINLRPIS